MARFMDFLISIERHDGGSDGVGVNRRNAGWSALFRAIQISELKRPRVRDHFHMALNGRFLMISLDLNLVYRTL